MEVKEIDDIIAKARKVTSNLRDDIQDIMNNTKDDDVKLLAKVTRSLLKSTSNQFEIVYELQNKVADLQQALNDLKSDKKT